MFKKPYKVKTSTTIKGSDRRKLRSLAESSFPNLPINDLNHLISNKVEMTQTKAMTHSGSLVMIYFSGTNPIFFQVENHCYPTMYTLWKYPNLLPTLVTNAPVLEKIRNGADLMAPGVIIDESVISEMGDLKLNEMCSVRISGNKAPIAVGIAVMSKLDLCQDDIKGKAATIAHSYGDTLWLSGDQQDLPMMAEQDVDQLIEEVENLMVCNAEKFEEDVQESAAAAAETETDATEENALESDCRSEDKVPEYSMDEILLNSFMTALKTFSKKISLPILTSTFYSTYVLKCCPPFLQLDIKKTTYKKLSVFLKKMQKEGLLQIKELSKGVESIVCIKLECDAFKSYRIDPIFKNQVEVEKKVPEEEPTSNIQLNYKFPTVTELFVISAQVKILFEKFKMRKGDTISGVCVKDVLKRYVKENSLQSDQNPRAVVLDPILTDCVSGKAHPEVMSWEELYSAITNRMPSAFQVQFENKDPIIRKGKLEPIQVTVDTRTGNKKVTLIQNLETYGIDHDKLAHHVQVAVAASTSLNPTQNGKGIIVLIQGNQVRYLQKLFLETYKVPRKYLQGLDNVPKKK